MFHASCAALTFFWAVSRVKGGRGGFGSVVAMFLLVGFWSEWKGRYGS